ncbi:RNA-binding protein RO60-like [Saccoglossus kowalevskii]
MAGVLNSILSYVVGTPQSEPMREDQVINNAGGYVWEVSDINRLRRFMCLGSEGGTYYVGEKELGLENAQCIRRMIMNGEGEKVVNEIKTFSVEGRTAKQNPILFALAICARDKDLKTKQAAYKVLDDVCRIPTHLFAFLELCEKLSRGTGWGRAHRRAVQDWYKRKSGKQLALAVTKYRQRNGWTHRDVLRLAHIKATKKPTAAVLKYIIKGLKVAREDFAIDEEADMDTENEKEEKETAQVLEFLTAVEEAKEAHEEEKVVQLIEKHRLVREHVPTQFLSSKLIWQALLREMPMTAMIRNLGKMTSIELLSDELSDEVSMVCEQLQCEESLKKARIHPFNVLLALKTYQSGHGDKGKLNWQPNKLIMNALDDAFYASFKNVEPTDKRFMLALDVSGSMSCNIHGASNVSAYCASAAMSMVTVRTEKNSHTVAFSHTMVPLKINASMKLTEVINEMKRIPMGATNCSLPMIHALKNNIPIDVFIVYTDCETWCGNVQPVEALRQYREKMNIDAKLIVCGMTSTGFTIADPDDTGMLDIAGFDSAAPEVIRNFIMGFI